MGALIAAEAHDLARLTSAAYQRAVAWYRAQGRSAADADELASAPHWHTMEAPSDHVTWSDMNHLQNADPAAMAAVWERVKCDADDQVLAGLHAADALASATPWQRALFLALRQGFYDEWQPRGGVERALLDTMALAFCVQLFWVEQAQQRATTDPRRDREGWSQPLQSTADAIDQAAQMADRFNRLLVRSLRSLRDLRRYTVVINNPAQVNIAGQQVNATRIERD